MTYQVLKLLHVLALFVWVGGMIFSHFFLRKPSALLPAELRFSFMHHVLRRFFNAVTVASVLVLLSGLWMIGRTARQLSRAGGSFEMPWSWLAMAVLGMLMVLVFFYVRFIPYFRLGRALKRADEAAAGAALTTIRQWVSFNLVLGIVVTIIAILG